MNTLPSMSTHHLLMIEDDTRLAQMVGDYLGNNGLQVTHMGDARSGLEQLQPADGVPGADLPDLVILDLMLPDMDGLEVCRRIRALPGPAAQVPVLMLTAKGDPMDRIIGLEIGADDYLPKPFEARELVARVRALLRRAAPGRAQSPLIRFDGLEIDLVRREVRVGAQVLALTSVEFKLLVALARVPGRALSREALNDAVQVGGYRPQDRTVDVQVARLRRRLAEAGPGADWIATVRGEGYVFIPR